jgi:hypothetical protein
MGITISPRLLDGLGELRVAYSFLFALYHGIGPFPIIIAEDDDIGEVGG